MAPSREAAPAGPLAVGMAAGFDERRMNPSRVSAQVAQRPRREYNARRAAAWNW